MRCWNWSALVQMTLHHIFLWPKCTLWVGGLLFRELNTMGAFSQRDCIWPGRPQERCQFHFLPSGTGRQASRTHWNGQGSGPEVNNSQPLPYTTLLHFNDDSHSISSRNSHYKLAADGRHSPRLAMQRFWRRKNRLDREPLMCTPCVWSCSLLIASHFSTTHLTLTC